MRRWLMGLIVTGCFVPGFVFAQSAVLLDANPATGYQGATLVDAVQAGQQVVVEVVGREIVGVSGFSAQIVFDASQLAFDGFVSGDVIPGFTGLKIDEGNGTVKVGGASVSGLASAAKGQLGLVRFNVLDGFAGNATVALGEVSVAKQGVSEQVQVVSQVVVGPSISEALVLDADLTPGHQGGFAVLDAQVGDVIAIEIYGHNVTGASGFSTVLNFDASQLSFESFLVEAAIPGLTGLKNTIASGEVEVGGASVTGVAQMASGRLGTVQFKVLSGFSGQTDIRLVNGQLVVGGDIQAFESDLMIAVSGIAGGPVAKTPDFDGNGKVDFPDFLMFAGAFGKDQNSPDFDERLDLDSSGAIDFPDFLQFAQSFGKDVGE